MRIESHGRRTPALAAALGLLLPAAIGLPEISAPSGTTRFVMAGNRTYAELAFVRPDGSLHRALAYVDMGSASMEVTESIFRELQLDRKPLQFRIGALTVEVPPSEIDHGRASPRAIGSDLEVEALLPAGVLEKYQVVIDHRAQTLTLARPGTIVAKGIPVPFRLKKETGLIAVDASVGGTTFAVTIDDGSAYTWLRRSVVQEGQRSHPSRERGIGAVGTANMMMSGDGTEASGILFRIPEIDLGGLRLERVGALAVEGGRGAVPGTSLLDWYSTKNAVPVAGWIGGNVLKDFRLTIDYPNRTTWWEKQAEPEIDDLDQVGLTLRSEHGRFFIAAVAVKNGRPTVDGVRPGDELIRVGDRDTRNAGMAAIFQMLHGSPGEARDLVLLRGGTPMTVSARVTRF
jgi:hypothetical protein